MIAIRITRSVHPKYIISPISKTPPPEGHAESPYHKYILHSEGTDVLFFNSFTNAFIELPIPPLSSLRNGEEYKGELSTYMGRWADLYWSEDEAI